MDDYFEKRKPRGKCPQCGEQNYVQPTYIRQRHLDQYGIEWYTLVSETKYKCTACKHVWSEFWSE